MNFSRFLKSPSAAGLSPPRRPRGWGETKRESATIPSSPARFLLEPLRKREEVGFETGRRISFGSLQLEKTAKIQATRAVAQALSEHVETFLSSTVEQYFALAENWMKYLVSIVNAYERVICLVKNLYKSCIITDFCKHQRIHYCKGAIHLALSNPFGKHFLALLSLIYRPGYFLYVFRRNSPFGLSQM